MRTKLICALLALCLFCSGCSVMDLDTQNLMSPPKATGDKADIQRAVSYTHLDVYKRQSILSGKHFGIINFQGQGFEIGIADD